MTKQKKTDSLHENLVRSIEQYVRGKGYKPSTEKELREALALHPHQKNPFNKALAAVIDQGILKKKKLRYHVALPEERVAVGTLRLHPRGFGFLECDDQLRFPQDIFIPRHLTKNGVDGDRVEAFVEEEVSSPKGPEGRIVSILQRSRTHVAGIIVAFSGRYQATAHVPVLGKERPVTVTLTDDQTAEKGDRVVLQIDDWGSEKEGTTAKLSHIIGNINDPSCDIDAAIEEHEIRKDFPSKVLEEVKKYGKQVRPSDMEGREDLRDLICVTIDPATAKDFDDALSLTKNKKGEYELGVHIADVSHYVRPGTALDDEAKLRCNSTYFPGRCIPMLPPILADNLCSLKPDVNRLTVSLLLRYSPTGELLNYRITRSVIRSRKRFSYGEAKEVLDGKRRSQHATMLHHLVELCGLFKKKRYERGSIEFAMPELALHCDEQGQPIGTEFIPYDITHQLVEECMLTTNERIASHLTEKGKDLSFRVHEVPPEENLAEFATIAHSFGFDVSMRPTPEELQKLFAEAFETPHGPHLATNYIRKMRLAVYSPDNIGHYGLSLSHYCHFTSPIRRYIDLVNHRILFGDEHELERLNEISQHCSEQERVSARAEGSVILLKKLRLLAEWKKKDPNRIYEAIITKVKNFGIGFEIKELLFEAFLPIHQLDHDFFVLSPDESTLRGVHEGYEYRIGGVINVSLLDVDFIGLNSQWYVVPGEPPPEGPVRRKIRSKDRILKKREKGKRKPRKRKKGR